MTRVGWTQSLAVAGAESIGLALVAALAFHLHRRAGMTPFIAVITLLAAAIPATVHQLVLDGGPLGTLPSVQAVVAPVVIAFVVLVHLIRGWRNAQLTAATVLVATAFVTLSALLAPSVPFTLSDGILAQDPLIPLTAGVLLWIGAAGASLGLLSVYQLSSRCPPFLAVALASLAGLTLQGGGLIAAANTGIDLAGTQGWGPLTLPITVGAAPVALVGIYAMVRLAGIWPETRQALVSRDPVGTDSQLEQAHELQTGISQAREAERQEADTYRQLIESADHGAYVCTPDGRITYANNAFTHILEEPDRDLVGENIRHVLGSSDEQGRPRFAEYPVKTGRHRARIQLPNGHERSIEVTVQPADEGQLYGRVHDRTEEVLRERVEEQKERAEFYVDLLRHDIGNYVMAPLTRLRMLQRREDLPEDAEEHLQASRDAVEDIADLLRRIDVLSDVDELRPEPVDAGSILEAVAERFSGQHPEATIEVDLPPQQVAIAGTPLIEEVFVNLVGNAIRHAGETATIELAAEPEGTDWVLSVRDDGPGVPDEIKEGIFDRTEGDESAGGKGLGLYIVKTITHAVGGDVWVEDRVPGEPDEGAAFKVRLSAVDPARLPEEDDAHAPGSTGTDQGAGAGVA